MVPTARFSPDWLNFCEFDAVDFMLDCHFFCITCMVILFFFSRNWLKMEV